MSVQVDRPPGSRAGMLSVAIKTKDSLYASYMPFINNGGLFINPPRGFQQEDNEFGMGAEVFILLTLLEETQRIPVAGRVVWITPHGADNGRLPGFGIAFNDVEGVARNKIEALLAGTDSSSKLTHTM